MEKDKLNKETTEFYKRDVWRKMKFRQYSYGKKSMDKFLNKIKETFGENIRSHEIGRRVNNIDSILGLWVPEPLMHFGNGDPMASMQLLHRRISSSHDNPYHRLVVFVKYRYKSFTQDGLP